MGGLGEVVDHSTMRLLDIGVVGVEHVEDHSGRCISAILRRERAAFWMKVLDHLPKI